MCQITAEQSSQLHSASVISEHLMLKLAQHFIEVVEFHQLTNHCRKRCGSHHSVWTQKVGFLYLWLLFTVCLYRRQKGEFWVLFLKLRRGWQSISCPWTLGEAEVWISWAFSKATGCLAELCLFSSHHQQVQDFTRLVTYLDIYRTGL